MRTSALWIALLLLAPVSSADAHRFASKVVDVEQTGTGFVVAASEGVVPISGAGCRLEPRRSPTEGAKAWWLLCAADAVPELRFDEIHPGGNEIVLRFRPEQGAPSWTRLGGGRDRWSPPVHPTKPTKIETDRFWAGFSAAFFGTTSWLLLVSLVLLGLQERSSIGKGGLDGAVVFVATHSVVLAIGAFGRLPSSGLGADALSALALSLPAAGLWIARDAARPPRRGSASIGRRLGLIALLGLGYGVEITRSLGPGIWDPNALASFHLGLELALALAFAAVAPLWFLLRQPRLRTAIVYGIGLSAAAMFGRALAEHVGGPV